MGNTRGSGPHVAQPWIKAEAQREAHPPQAVPLNAGSLFLIFVLYLYFHTKTGSQALLEDSHLGASKSTHAYTCAWLPVCSCRQSPRARGRARDALPWGWYTAWQLCHCPLLPPPQSVLALPTGQCIPARPLHPDAQSRTSWVFLTFGKGCWMNLAKPHHTTLIL